MSAPAHTVEGMPDRYGTDVLATDWRAPQRGRAVEATAELGAVVEEVQCDFCGEIVAVDRDLDTLTLEDRRGRRRSFPLGTGFLLEGKPVILRAPVRKRTHQAGPHGLRLGGGAAARGRGWRGPAGSTSRAATTPSWSRGSGATTCGSRAWSSSSSAASTTSPVTCAASSPARAAGSACWSTTSSPGSKESRIADEVARSPVGAHVLVVGHPFVDVWQAVKPDRIGLAAWPEIPRSVEWKKGVCAHLGWPHATQADIARAWQHILARVTSYDDLEPALLGRVEELIDFVTSE